MSKNKDMNKKIKHKICMSALKLSLKEFINTLYAMKCNKNFDVLLYILYYLPLHPLQRHQRHQYQYLFHPDCLLEILLYHLFLLHHEQI